MPDSSSPSDPHREEWLRRLNDEQTAKLVYLEATDGQVRNVTFDHPLIEEFELGENTCMMEFDHMRVLVGNDGSLSPLPKIKRAP